MLQLQRLFSAIIAATLLAASLPAYAQEAASGEGEVRAMQAAYDAGVKALSENNPKEALVRFNEAIAGDRGYIEAYIGKGDALRMLEDYGAAIQTYSQIQDLGNMPPAALNGRGEAYLKTGTLDNISLAAADFSRALELDPANPVILSNVGHILINYGGDAQGAIRRLNDAIALNPQDARAYRDRGWAHARLQDFKAAEDDLRKAAELAPEDFENYAVLANVFLFQDNLLAANDALTQAINAYKPTGPTDPKIYAGGYLSRADAWLRLGEKATDQAAAEAAFKNAIADAEAVIKANPEGFPDAGQAYFRRGRAQRMLQQFSEAVDSFTLAIEVIPPGQDAQYLSTAHMYRGICWYYIGSYELARGDFEQASSVGGGFGDPRIFLWIGFTYHKQGDYRDAIEAYSQAIAKSPKFAMAHTNKGRAYMDLREYRRAIESFNNAILAEPSVGEHYYNVAFACTRVDDWEKAEHFLNIALRKQNPQPKWYRLMSSVLRERGREELADEYQRKAEQAQPQQAAGR
jgi:tetratricopeptide (TPR) repeat protein